MNQNTLPDKKTTWLLRLYYFAWVGAPGFIYPFLNIFFTRQGLNGQQIGLVTAASSLALLIASPFWTRWSESSRHPRRVLQAALILSGLGWIVLGRQYLFGWIFIISALRTIPAAGIWPISDDLALRLQGSLRAGYGQIRLWGSVGWAVFVLVSGWLIERSGLSIGFLSTGAAYCASALILFFLPGLESRPRQTRQETQAASQPSVLHSLWASPALLGLGGMLILTGIGNSGVLQFETVYMDDLGAREALIGVAGMFSAAVEVPGMLLADHFIRKHGHDRILLLSLILHVVMRVMVFVWPSIPVILFSRLFNGIAFSLYMVAIVVTITNHALTSQRGTMLAIFNVTLPGLVSILASPLSGAIYDAMGGRVLYLLAAIGYLVGWLGLRFTQHLPPRGMPGLPPSPAPD